MNRPLRWYDYITVNIYFLGLTVLAQTNGLVFPLLIQKFVGEEVKGAYLGTLRLATLMAALLMQAVMGMLSDRSRARWGRRRPFIFAGTLVDLVFLAGIGFSAGMSGMAGYWFLFAMAMLLSVSSNTAQGAEQGLIPDLVPPGQRGRFSGIKAVLEIPLPMILVSFTVARLISAGNMWAAIMLAMVIVTVAMLLTMLVPETPVREAPPFDWAPIRRLALMTALFTLIIWSTGMGVRVLGRALHGAGSPAFLVMVMGLAGLLAMLVAVGLGVWTSVRTSIGGAAARQNPSFTWWVVNRLAFLAGTTNLTTFAIYFIQGRLGYVGATAAKPAANLVMVVGFFILVSALASAWLADRFGRKPLVGVSGLTAALGTLIALSAPSMSVLYAGGSLIGLATGLFFAANWALGTQIVPADEAGRYLGISNLAGAGAGAVGAYIGGPIADYFTVNVPGAPGLGYSVIFAIYGMMFLLSVVALRGVHEPGPARVAAVEGRAALGGK